MGFLAFFFPSLRRFRVFWVFLGVVLFRERASDLVIALIGTPEERKKRNSLFGFLLRLLLLLLLVRELLLSQILL